VILEEEIIMANMEEKPNYRLKSIKAKKRSNEEARVLSISNIKNGKCISRRDFIKASGALLVALGMSQLSEGCRGGGDEEESGTRSETIPKRYYGKTFRFNPTSLLSVDAIAFNHDATKIAALADDFDYYIKIWDVSSKNLVLKIRCGSWTHSINFSPDGRKIVSGQHDGQIIVWDTLTGDPLLKIKANNIIFHVAFSPDGSWIASGERDKVRIWDASDGRLLMTLETDGPSRSMDISPDGTKIATSSWSGVKIWNTSNGMLLLDLPISVPLDSDSALAFNSDGAKIAAISDWSLKIWNSSNGAILLEKETSNLNLSIAWSPDGTKIVVGGVTTGCKRPIEIYDSSNGNLLLALSDYADTQVHCVAWSPDGEKIATGYKSLVIWSASSGNYLFHLIDPSLGEKEITVDCTEVTPWMNTCTCHSVCTCDTVAVCTCDTVEVCGCVGMIPVCTCDKVCTCDLVCTCVPVYY